jgi:hypothetical protein
MPTPGERLEALPDPLHVDLGIAAVRATFGVALLVAPGAVLQLLAGPEASTPGGRLMARAAGVRDLAMAVGSVWALDRPADLRRTNRLHAVVDAGDAVAGALAFPHLSPLGRLFALAGGTSAALTGFVQAERWHRRYGPQGSDA